MRCINGEAVFFLSYFAFSSSGECHILTLSWVPLLPTPSSVPSIFSPFPGLSRVFRLLLLLYLFSASLQLFSYLPFAVLFFFSASQSRKKYTSILCQKTCAGVAIEDSCVEKDRVPLCFALAFISVQRIVRFVCCWKYMQMRADM